MELVAIRKEQNKTQLQVAKEAGLTERYYQSIEYGKSIPRADKAIKVADTLNIPISDEFRAVFGGQ